MSDSREPKKNAPPDWVFSAAEYRPQPAAQAVQAPVEGFQEPRGEDRSRSTNQFSSFHVAPSDPFASPAKPVQQTFASVMPELAGARRDELAGAAKREKVDWDSLPVPPPRREEKAVPLWSAETSTATKVYDFVPSTLPELEPTPPIWSSLPDEPVIPAKPTAGRPAPVQPFEPQPVPQMPVAAARPIPQSLPAKAAPVAQTQPVPKPAAATMNQPLQPKESMTKESIHEPATEQAATQLQTAPLGPLPSSLQRAVSAIRAALPYVHKILPLLDGNVGSAMANILGPQHGAPSANLHNIEKTLEDIKAQNRSLSQQLLEQGSNMRRIEDQLETVRAATERTTSEQEELYEAVKAVGRRANLAITLALILLAAGIGANVYLYLQYHR